MTKVLKVCLIVCGLTSTGWSQSNLKSPLPQEATDMMSQLVGTWATHGERNGKPIVGVYQAWWNPAKTGLMLRDNEGGLVSTGIGYWDDSSNQYVEAWAGHSLTVDVRYRRKTSSQDWTGTGVVQLHDGTRMEGPVGVEFGDGTFTFHGQAGDEELKKLNTRQPLEAAQESLEALAEFAIGGSWVCEQQSPPAKHTYRWRPGKTVLTLDRQGGRSPGISHIAVNHASQCLDWLTIDNSGLIGSSVSLHPDKDTWQLFGHCVSESAIQDLVINIKAREQMKFTSPEPTRSTTRPNN